MGMVCYAADRSMLYGIIISIFLYFIKGVRCADFGGDKIELDNFLL